MKRKRGRPKKDPIYEYHQEEYAQSNDDESILVEPDMSYLSNPESSTKAVKRKRGRPRKDSIEKLFVQHLVEQQHSSSVDYSNNQSILITPEEINYSNTALDSTVPVKKKRGRPRKDPSDLFHHVNVVQTAGRGIYCVHYCFLVKRGWRVS